MLKSGNVLETQQGRNMLPIDH